MGLRSKRWECKECGRRHRTDRKQCVECGYAVLTPATDGRRDRLSTAVLALLPAVLSALTMGLLAWALFF